LNLFNIFSPFMPESNFVDYIKIFCRSGKGGAGSAHLRREKYIPKGGPDGGDGGRGGNIYVKGNHNIWTLLHLRYKKHVFAGNGDAGSSATKTGSDGKDIILEVPLGTIIREEDTGKQLVEITENGETKILLKGGRGGLGNVHFKSATNQTPRYAQPGEEGIENWLIFELKVLADVGLVGFPNAGKSTLLSVISEARPKIAEYAFTTLEPSIGIVPYRDDRSFVVADIPGIIEGASEGKGLGLRFLRHIERNSILLFLIPSDSKDINNEYRILLKELEQYNPELLDKKRLLAITKSDLLDNELTEEISVDLPEVPSVFISSVAHANLVNLKDMLWEQLNV
jgi:GTP-binding protein